MRRDLAVLCRKALTIHYPRERQDDLWLPQNQDNDSKGKFNGKQKNDRNTGKYRRKEAKQIPEGKTEDGGGVLIRGQTGKKQPGKRAGPFPEAAPLCSGAAEKDAKTHRCRRLRRREGQRRKSQGIWFGCGRREDGHQYKGREVFTKEDGKQRRVPRPQGRKGPCACPPHGRDRQEGHPSPAGRTQTCSGTGV